MNWREKWERVRWAFTPGLHPVPRSKPEDDKGAEVLHLRRLWAVESEAPDGPETPWRSG